MIGSGSWQIFGTVFIGRWQMNFFFLYLLYLGKIISQFLHSRQLMSTLTIRISFLRAHKFSYLSYVYHFVYSQHARKELMHALSIAHQELTHRLSIRVRNWWVGWASIQVRNWCVHWAFTSDTPNAWCSEMTILLWSLHSLISPCSFLPFFRPLEDWVSLVGWRCCWYFTEH